MVIVGGGVAGLSAAYFLCRDGAEVVVLERGRLGAAASAGNAGWICPAQAGPVPEPGLVRYGLRSLVDRDSALYFAPRYVPRMLPWLVRFAMHCNRRAHWRGAQALARLGARTFELTEELQADGVSFELHRQGLTVAGETEQSVAAFLRGLDPLRALGYDVPARPLGGAELQALEPALSPDVRAGLLIEQHWHVYPPTLMRGLAARLREMDVELREETDVLGFDGLDGRVARVRTSAGEVGADAVVLAAGAWTPRIARDLGLRVPVQPGKGYSFELELAEPLRRSLLLLEPHVGCSPMDAGVRVAGTMEFSGVNARLDRRRIDGIVRGAARLLPGVRAPAGEEVWSGLRPIAPDGLPIVGRSARHRNVYLATAYSMLGMTLAAPAAELLAREILTGTRPAELAPFAPDRFGGRRPALRQASTVR